MTTPAQSVRWGAATASTLYGVLLYLLGLKPEQDLKYAFAYVPALLGYLVLVFDKWAWRWPGIHHLTGRPRLDGTWRTTLTPSPESHIPAGGNRGPIRAYLTIEQSYWTLHATLRTAESASRSSNATIETTNGSGVGNFASWTRTPRRSSTSRAAPATPVPAARTWPGAHRPNSAAATTPTASPQVTCS